MQMEQEHSGETPGEAETTGELGHTLAQRAKTPLFGGYARTAQVLM